MLHILRTSLQVFLCCCLGWPISHLAGQSDYRFEHFGQEDGLSSNSIRVLFQDEQGFVWIGSDNGLDRFDGRGFLNFRFDPENPNSLTSNRVNSLSLDAKQKLWIGTSNGLCFLDLNSGGIQRVAITEAESGPISYDVRAVLVDHQGHIWVGTLSNGLFKLTPKESGGGYDKKQFLPDDQDENSLAHQGVINLLQQEDYLWVGTAGGVCRMHIESEIFTPISDVALLKEDQAIKNLIVDLNGNIVFPVAKHGVFYFDPKEIPLSPKPYFEFDFLDATRQPDVYTHVVQDDKGQSWIGTDVGVLLVGPAQQSYTLLKTSVVRRLMVDRTGRIWAGFVSTGVGRESRIMDAYQYFQHDPQNPNSVAPGQVRTITEDQQGNLWVGYLFEGLEQFSWDEQQQTLIKRKQVRHDPNRDRGLVSNRIIEIFTDSKGFIWVATNGDGLNKLNPISGQIETYLHDPNNPASLSGNRIWGLSEDHHGYIWVGEFTTGLNRLDPNTGLVKRFQYQADNPNSLSHNRIKSMVLDSEGDLWIGTNGGLNRLDVETEEFTHFLHLPQDSTTLSGNVVYSIYEDFAHNLWVGTTLGLNKMSGVIGPAGAAGVQIKRIYESSGLPSNSIIGIQGDGHGKLWVSTDNGIAKLVETAAESRFVVINNQDGLEYGQFLNKGYYYSQNRQEFYFGSRHGLLVLPNQQDRKTELPTQLLVSALSKQTMDGKEGKKSEDAFVNSEEVWKLTHKDRIITIKLSDFNWDKSKRYEYRLAGFDANWYDLPNNMELTYTKLQAGKYTLYARATTDDPVDEDGVALLRLRMYPPWWKTSWAYGLYLLAFLAAIYGLYGFQLGQQLKKQETENLRALEQFKNQLYTNITHEFKTPLTVINGVVEQVPGHHKMKEVVQRNSKNLLDLINQILDLRKLEVGKVKLDWVQADVVLYFQYILETYETLAEHKEVKLHFIPRQQHILMDMDKEKLLRIVSNLLSNAIKFTPSGGDIYLGVEVSGGSTANQGAAKVLRFSVKDTGVGIPIEDQAFIFDRFYQVKPDTVKRNDAREETFGYRGPGGGTGIGLALTKDLVELLEGEIRLESEEGKGATFTVLLPVRQMAPKEDIQEADISPPIVLPEKPEEVKQVLEVPAVGASTTGLQLLIVEDNDDVRDYLVSLLQHEYELHLAVDGQAGIEMAFKLSPDIIISDLMMPRKDGFQLLTELKGDVRTSHIPIVMLTAKSSVQAKIEGLKKGADAYLAKPFHQEELFVTLSMLLELRQLLRERYANIGGLVSETTKEETPFAQEDAFIAQLKGVIVEQMSDPDFGVLNLSETMGISRSFLHRKLKALTNSSATDIIRTIRLHKAQQLLQNQDLNVSEVAAQVGLPSISSFSRAFKKEFGVSPRAYREEQQ